ncbi:MAG: type II toxin-antitoxin system RelE/ParE family toxin [Bacteroidales bacterium]|jgi:plasmid stabilization system protein ParE
MPKKVIWSPQSEIDLLQITDYLNENWEGKVVIKFIDIIDEITNQISLNPRQFPIIQKKGKIRKCVITKHNSLYYRERKEFVDILRIYDNRQDPHKLKFM